MSSAPAPPGFGALFRRPEFRNLTAISITVALGFGMVIPVLPTLARSFGVGLAAVGLVQFVFSSTRLGAALGAGLFVDRFGDRASTMAGLLIVAVSSYAMGFSETFVQLVLARGFGGVGSALFITGLQTRILRIIEPEMMGRATGIFASSFLVGIAAGPALGGFVAEAFGTSSVFHLYATGLLVATVIAWVVMRGEHKHVPAEKKSPLESIRAALPLFSDLRYLVALLATLVGWWTLTGPTQTVGVVFAEEELGLSSAQRGIALTMLAIGEILVLFVSGRAADRYGRRAVLVPALVVIAAGTFSLGQVEEATAWLFFPAMLAIGCGVAASRTAAGGLLADAIPQGSSGAAVGANQMFGDLGALIAPLAIGFVAEEGSYELAYIVAAVPAALVLIPALRLAKGIGTGSSEPTTEPSEPIG